MQLLLGPGRRLRRTGRPVACVLTSMDASQDASRGAADAVDDHRIPQKCDQHPCWTSKPFLDILREHVMGRCMLGLAAPAAVTPPSSGGVAKPLTGGVAAQAAAGPPNAAAGGHGSGGARGSASAEVPGRADDPQDAESLRAACAAAAACRDWAEAVSQSCHSATLQASGARGHRRRARCAAQGTGLLAAFVDPPHAFRDPAFRTSGSCPCTHAPSPMRRIPRPGRMPPPRPLFLRSARPNAQHAARRARVVGGGTQPLGGRPPFGPPFGPWAAAACPTRFLPCCRPGCGMRSSCSRCARSCAGGAACWACRWRPHRQSRRTARGCSPPSRQAAAWGGESWACTRGLCTACCWAALPTNSC